MSAKKSTQEIIVSVIEALNTNPRAFALGMGQSYSKIYDLYRGRTKIITYPVLESITNTYNIRRAYLTTGEGDMFEDTSKGAESASDPVSASFINTITTLNNELTKQKEKCAKLEEMLRRILAEYPQVADLLSDSISSKPKVADNEPISNDGVQNE